jgi:competence ComEA-like helix-hairpin-helix protein
MRQSLHAGGARFALPLFLACLLILASASCVKLPRQTLSLSGQTAPLVSQPGAATQPLININTASFDELERLPGIGKGLAARIIVYRNQYGRFRRPEHLMMVRGISDRRYRAMRALICAE